MFVSKMKRHRSPENVFFFLKKATDLFQKHSFFYIYFLFVIFYAIISVLFLLWNITGCAARFKVGSTAMSRLT